MITTTASAALALLFLPCRASSDGGAGTCFLQLSAPVTHPRGPEAAIDVVSVAHHDDAPILLGYALPSIFRSVQGLRNMYVVGTPKMVSMLEQLKNKTNLRFPADRVFPVNQEEFPFSLGEIAAQRSAAGFYQPQNDFKDRNAWTYQQLLKLYAHQVLGQKNDKRPELLPNALIADADVIWLKPTQFVYKQGDHGGDTCWYSIGNTQSGSFKNDVETGKACTNSLLPQTRMTELTGGDGFTAITHHSVFQADVVKALLDEIAVEKGSPAWKALAVADPYLSEYDLYLSWAASKFADRVALRSLPYINTGRQELAHLDPEDFDMEMESPSIANESITSPSFLQVASHFSVAYAAFHDDYPRGGACCVNIVKNFQLESGTACSGCGSVSIDAQNQASMRLRSCQGQVYPVHHPPEQPLQLVTTGGRSQQQHSNQGAELLAEYARCMYSK